MSSKIVALIKNKYFLSLSGNVIMSGLGMLTTAVLYHSLPTDDVGIWLLYLSTLNLLDTFRSGFLTTAVIKFYAGATPERAAEIAGSAWFLALCITGILFLVNIPGLFFVKDISIAGYVMYIKWSGLCFILMLPQFIALIILQAEQRFDRMLYVRMVNQGSFLFFILVLAIIGKINLMWVLYSYFLSYFITSMYALIMGWTRVATLKSKSKACILELYHFGKFSVGTNLSSNMFGFSDASIINYLLGPAALAIYNLGQNLMQVVEILLRSFIATAMPSMSAAYNQGSPIGVIHILKKYVGMITLIILPITIGGWLLAHIPINILGGHKYMTEQGKMQAVNVFRLFLTFALLSPADRFFGLTIDVINRPIINFYKVLIMLAVNITFDFLGIYLFGNVYGVVLSSAMWVIVGACIGYWALNKYYYKFSFWNMYSLGYAEGKILLKGIWQKFRTNKYAG